MNKLPPEDRALVQVTLLKGVAEPIDPLWLETTPEAQREQEARIRRGEPHPTYLQILRAHYEQRRREEKAAAAEIQEPKPEAGAPALQASGVIAAASAEAPAEEVAVEPGR